MKFSVAQLLTAIVVIGVALMSLPSADGLLVILFLVCLLVILGNILAPIRPEDKS